MIYPVFSVRDVKVGFAQPILDQTEETAIRNFRSQCLDAKINPTLFYTPEDFSLYKIGEYDTETGAISPIVPPKHLIDAINFKEGDE